MNGHSTEMQLYQLLEAARQTGETLERVKVVRCPVGCRQRAEYIFRGQTVTVAGPIRLPELRIPGRAWVGDPPEDAPFGCGHALMTAD